MDAMSLPGQPGAFAAARTSAGDDLAARARRGDDEAFRLIFDRYAKPVISFIYDMVGQRELAEELAQETFVRAYKGLATMHEDTKLSTWLFGIAKNVAREALRSRRRTESHVDLEDASASALSDDRPRPDDELLTAEFSSVVQKALAALDEDKRLVFTLKIFQQKSYEEIAEITGFSVAKLKTDLHRARAEMRRRIGPYLGGCHAV
jgi:RNA polymerase sigma-70 factor, ECF subfamily